jgi:cob(I)alamin adenosyltransferase
MSIYTKAGDGGATSLGNGARVSKAAVRVEAYGMVDELCSHLGLLRAMNVDAHHREALLRIQEMLMTCAAEVSLCKGFALKEADVHLLEREIDALQKQLPPLKRFVLPGGNIAAAQCHVARCVCRRTERTMIQLLSQEGVGGSIAPAALNRLSDYLFVLARTLSLAAGGKETFWLPTE